MMNSSKTHIDSTRTSHCKTLLYTLIATAALVFNLPTFAADSSSTETEQSNMGGPYVIGGNANENSLSANAGKVAEFGAYYAKALFYSQIIPLTPRLLRQSMKANLAYDGNGEPLPQMYNYVIENNVLYVAIWQPRQAALESNTDCNLDFDRLSGYMPDAYEADNKDCPINVYSGKDVGIEDAVSKHFLISQLGGDAGKLENYVPKEWIQTTVDYAGEIHVYPTYNHNKGRYRYQYTINSNSGTYRPDNGNNNLCSESQEPQVNLDYLNGAADVFHRILKKSPTSLDVINYGDAGEVTTSIAYPLTQTCYSIN
ncbi:hypothetical protein [Shewanella surugensis]|uniref:Uncharacterized protein n=1 Tax=Shewanella surugensis TaxID=212020 RepID=A0ABT0LJX8_9GAMM|nr:hypothetical protein [Shewanella surugensis]MCL1127988.1 hypothetical protein [Shewanella surugensis]